MREMTELEECALTRLRVGDLDGFGDLLEAGDWDTDVPLHPRLRSVLLAQIRGAAHETDLRLTHIQHPDLDQGDLAKLVSTVGQAFTAHRMVEEGALKRGSLKNAVADAMARTKLSRKSIMKRWARFKDIARNDSGDGG